MRPVKQLKDILGKPGEGIHFHVCGIAIMDVLGTFVLALLLGWLACRHRRDTEEMLAVSCLVFFPVLLILGEILHLIIGVDTTVARWLRRLLD